ncbi:MAG: hypothetical protein HKN94_08780 [Acidimicrobiales bacterium]|nr:hypothetical protein [Acidimicrobiales bacterium]RZV44022.1 MAG: hypothetical protein EX269_12340 [Acidimicrobiales bacterium]
MSPPVLFLLGAVSLSMLGGMIVWLSSRPRKQRFGHSIHSFNRDLNALAPPRKEAPRGKPGPRPRLHDRPPVRK